MTELPSLVVQSILYHNESQAIVRAAQALCNSAYWARVDGVLGSWQLALGDCGSSPTLSTTHIKEVEEHVAAAGGETRYTVFGENLGHGGGHNRLAPLSSTDLILFLNPDAQVAPDTIATLVSSFTPGAGALDGRQLPLEHPKDFDSVTGDTSWASGACLLTSRAVFEEAGGFDHETFFMYCDDVDYSWRVKLNGHRVLHEPAARVFHDKRLTVDGHIEPSAAEIYYSAEAALMLAHKYSRPEIVENILRAFARQDAEPPRRAAAEYTRRKTEGRLPAPLDPDRRVGQFIDGNYAVHRY